MNLSAMVCLRNLHHYDDDTGDDSLTVQAMDSARSAIEVIIKHNFYSNPRVVEVRRNGLQLDRPLVDTLVISLWRAVLSRSHYDFATEFQWEIVDLRPALESMFYRADAARIAHRMAGFQTLVAKGSDVLTAVID